MQIGSLTWLGLVMVVFLTASAMLKSHALSGTWISLIIALSLYTLGNFMMIRLMRESGMAVAISVSAVLQLLLATLIAVLLFQERPLAIQWGGIGLGVVAVILILWPQWVKP